MEYKTTQREIKRLIKAGAAIELTDTKTVPCGRLQTVAMSFGIYGMNGGLFRDVEPGNYTAFRAAMGYYSTIANREMKQTLKATAAVLAFIAAGLLFWYIVIEFMWMCYYAGIRM